jgi:hypothetical protein
MRRLRPQEGTHRALGAAGLMYLCAGQCAALVRILPAENR